MDILFLVVLIVVMFGMMFWQSKKAKQQQAERQDFRSNLQPGTEVITIGGIIGKVVSVEPWMIAASLPWKESTP